MSTLAIVLLVVFCTGIALAFLASSIYIHRRRAHEAKALAELVESKRFYLTLIDNNLDTLAVCDAEGHLRFVNHSFIEILGFTQEESARMKVHDYVHRDDCDRFLDEWDQLVSTREPVLFTPFRFADAHGVYHWKRLMARNMLHDPDIRGLILSSSDITDLIDAMEAQRLTEQRIRVAMTGADIAVFNLDLEGRLTWMFNPLLDMPPEQLLGKTAYEYLPHDVAERLSAMRQRVLEQGGHQVEELEFTEGGKRHVISFHYEQLHGADGQLIGLVGAAADITKLRTMSEQLEASQRMEAIGQLTGGIAHDFNNLLAVIVGNLELLKDHLATNPQLGDFVDIALKAADRGAALTRSLLAFARKQSLEIQRVDPNKILAEIAELLRRSLPPGIRLAFRSEPHVWPCRADTGQLQNAVINLVVNSRDAMPEGGAITISTANTRLAPSYGTPLPPDVTPGDYVQICVTDTGTGMPPEVVDRVFEPFFTTKGQSKGSGLGLSIVYGFAKQLGGHLSIDSTPGEGTSVCLYVPRLTEEENVPAPDHRPAVPPVRGATILVVDDDEDVRQLTSALLTRAGYRTLEANSGEAAANLLQTDSSIDLLLTDMLLGPGPSGLDLTEEAQKLRPDLPIVMMSGYIDTSAADTMERTSTAPLLRKPFRRQDLENAVSEALAASRAATTANTRHNALGLNAPNTPQPPQP